MVCKNYWKGRRMNSRYGEWISVKDGLPPRATRVLVSLSPREGHGMHVIYYSSLGDWHIHSRILSIEDITHWMPLPKVPEKECKCKCEEPRNCGNCTHWIEPKVYDGRTLTMNELGTCRRRAYMESTSSVYGCPWWEKAKCECGEERSSTGPFHFYGCVPYFSNNGDNSVPLAPVLRGSPKEKRALIDWLNQLWSSRNS